MQIYRHELELVLDLHGRASVPSSGDVLLEIRPAAGSVGTLGLRWRGWAEPALWAGGPGEILQVFENGFPVIACDGSSTTVWGTPGETVTAVFEDIQDPPARRALYRSAESLRLVDARDSSRVFRIGGIEDPGHTHNTLYWA